ncbi:hypothetical protein [Pseudoramibacter alactolyticus]|jgi:hypothetical protein|uniref:hypothetical protein n=1 Tax=Pseudoramibacter alactolyticus TaxID=113287 RepID=UPI0028E6631F|nr:hypothetical protein [Pseudoramibacter alactolyticus]
MDHWVPLLVLAFAWLALSQGAPHKNRQTGQIRICLFGADVIQILLNVFALLIPNGAGSFAS